MANAAMKVGAFGFLLWLIAVVGLLVLQVTADIFTADFFEIVLLAGALIIALSLLFTSIGLFGLWKHYQSWIAIVTGVIGVLALIAVIVFQAVPFIGIEFLTANAVMLGYIASLLTAFFLVFIAITLVGLEGLINNAAVLPAGIFTAIAGSIGLIMPEIVYANLVLVPATILCIIAFLTGK